jgi:four helix bundle protein
LLIVDFWFQINNWNKGSVMNADELKQRTKRFGLEVIKLIEVLPKTKTGDVIGRQLLRCGTSFGANYRSACRGRSKADFISKAGIALEEPDETLLDGITN